MVIVEECRENPRAAELRQVDGKWQYASAYDRKQMIEYGDETQANQLLEFFNSNSLPEECA